MRAHAYTIHDSPEVVQRIEDDLRDVVATVRDADSHLRSLVLTGGFARGEGATLDGAPQNDYDLIAIRGMGRPRRAYRHTKEELERRLGLHIDLAPVAAWRLPWTPPSIFWYETALRGRVLWGQDLLRRIPVRSARELDPHEGLRLLANRSAGLLLVTDSTDAHAHRLQAAKALLAALDAHLLAAGRFAPSQTERHRQWTAWRPGAAPDLEPFAEWVEWAYAFKCDPGSAPVRDPVEAWHVARRALLEAVPAALRHARLPDLGAAARRDSWTGRAAFLLRRRGIPGAARLLPHPTARVRVATLRLLERAEGARISRHDVEAELGRVGDPAEGPLQVLERLRGATLQ